MALGSTQHLTEMSTRNIFWGKGGQCVGLTTLPPSCAGFPEIWGLQPSGTLRSCLGLYRDCFTYTRFVRKVSDRIFLCEHLMDYNLARLHEPTLNLSAHA